MKIWTWKRLFKEFEKHPEQLEAYKKLPAVNSTAEYPSFGEWLSIDNLKSDIVAAVIDCRRADDLRAQRQKMIEYARRYSTTPESWVEIFNSCPEHQAKMLRITRRFARQKKCHRVFDGKKAGVRCYCDEHIH